MTVYQWLMLFGVPGMLTTLGGFICVLYRQNRALKNGMKALLQDRLLQGYRIYQEKGWADYEDRVNLENVWKQYHALGGNGDRNDMRKTVRARPSRKDGMPMKVSDQERSNAR